MVSEEGLQAVHESAAGARHRLALLLHGGALRLRSWRRSGLRRDNPPAACLRIASGLPRKRPTGRWLLGDLAQEGEQSLLRELLPVRAGVLRVEHCTVKEAHISDPPQSGARARWLCRNRRP